MATTKANTSKLVSELCVLPSQDTTAFGISAKQVRDMLGRAIDRYAASDDHARRMVDWLLFERYPEQAKFRPVPGEIKLASAIVSPELTPQATAPRCRECSGTGCLIRGLLVWREQTSDGHVLPRRRMVESESEAIRLSGEMSAETHAEGLSCAVACPCRKGVAAA